MKLPYNVSSPLLVAKFCLLLALVVAPLVAVASSPSTPPSDADVNRLLAAARAQSMLDSMLPQIEAMQQQQFAQLQAERKLSEEQQEKLRRIQMRTRVTVHEALSWPKLRPMYVELYKGTFSRDDVIAMAEFYESPAGQSLLDKTPLLMQNLMQEVQEKMLPMLTDLQKDLEQIINEPPPAK